MACVRKRRGKWIVDYRDAFGQRHWATCRTQKEAKYVCAEKERESRQPVLPGAPFNLTVAGLAEDWLKSIRASVKRRTLDSYQETLRLHILPGIGRVKVRQLHKGHVRTLLAEKLAHGLARNSVRLIHATIRALLNRAVDDGIIQGNPASRLGRQLRLVAPAAVRQEQIKAMTRWYGPGTSVTF